MIKAITFDLWNTLFENRFYTTVRLDFFTYFLKKKRISHSFEEIQNSFESNFNLQDIDLKAINYRHIYTEDRISNVLNDLNMELSPSEFDLIKIEFEKALLKDPPPLKVGVQKTLETLSKDYKIGLISNTGITPGQVLVKALQNHNILKYFDATTFSDEIGFFKPKSILFETTLKKLKCEPNLAIHIGDDLETDIKGAKDYNMFSIWINDSDSQIRVNIKPDYEVKDISEIIPIIKSIS